MSETRSSGHAILAARNDKMRNTLSTVTVARLLGVAVASISKWIDAGQLKAGRTPGGHRRVTKEDLVAFLRR